MQRGLGASPGLSTVAALFLCAAPPASAAVNPSVCLVADEGCLAPGGIRVRVILGPSDRIIVGGQIVVNHDPQALRLIAAEPGRACDPASPFVFKLFEEANVAFGEGRCAFGINFLKSLPAPMVSTTLACLSFAPTGNSMDPSSICLSEGQHPFETELVDNVGHAVPIDNSKGCPPGDPPPILACDDVMSGVNCNCVPATTDCRGLDTPCRTGVCNPMTSHCEVVSMNEGGPCDDLDSCTTVDRCSEGICVGEGCTNSSLCASSSSCLGLDPLLTIKIRLSEGDRVIQGAQFSFEYDPTKLTLLDVSPGGACDDASPFLSELAEVVDQTAGEVFYAVGVELGGMPGTKGPATLACLTFAHLGEPGADVCLFEGPNPFVSVLVDEFGQAVAIGDANVCPSNREPPTPLCAELQSCNIPAVSEWGLAALTLLLLVAAKVRFGHLRVAGVAPSTDRPPL